HRVLAPGFGKTPEQLIIIGNEEDHFALNPTPAQLVDELRDGGDFRRRIASVQADGRALIGRLGAAHGVRNEWLQQRRRDVVDAIKAQVLEHVQSHALTGTGQTAEDEDTHALWLSTPWRRCKR